VTLPPGRNGLNAWRMAVLSTFREPSLGRHVHRELLRSVLLDVTPIISATACHQRNYVERYSRFKRVPNLRTRLKRLVRRTLCFSKTEQMHDLVIGLFMNRYEFGLLL
jgi:hypothetical protein